MKIPIVRPGQGTVSMVRFDGDKGYIVTQNQQYAEATKARMAVENFSHLSRIDVMTDFGIVKYWEGFHGWLAGLLLALPSVGLEVGTTDMTWPEAKVEG